MWSNKDDIEVKEREAEQRGTTQDRVGSEKAQTAWYDAERRAQLHHLIIALAVGDSVCVLLVKVKSMLHQELD